MLVVALGGRPSRAIHNKRGAFAYFLQNPSAKNYGKVNPHIKKAKETFPSFRLFPAKSPYPETQG